MFHSCEKCKYYVRDREAMLRCMGRVRNRCTIKNNARIDKPFRSGLFCKSFKMKE